MGEQNYRRISLKEGGNASLVFVNQDRCLYKCTRTKEQKKYLICTEIGCSARGIIIDEGNFERTDLAIQHSHENNHQVRADAETTFEELRDIVRERKDRRVKALHTEYTRGLRLEVAGLLIWENCRQTLERIRNKSHPPCKSLIELKNYLENENSAVFEQFGRIHDQRFYVGSANGQLMFANLILIDALPELVELFIDGTFSIVPFKACQLLVVMAELQGCPRPIFYCIMKSQTVEDYEMPLNFLAEVLLGEHRVIITVTSDFEQAIRAAVRNLWPHADVVGCNFHHCQALERRAKQSPGLVGGKLARGTLYRKILLMYMRISLLPLNRILSGFRALLDYIQEKGDEEDFNSNDFDAFSDYFERTWLNRFLPVTWCVSERDRRTNNHVEGHNRRIKMTIDKNPTPWEFLQGLQDLMIDSSAKYERDRRINAPQPPTLSRLAAPLESSLQKLLNNDIDEIEFLTEMALS